MRTKIGVCNGHNSLCFKGDWSVTVKGSTSNTNSKAIAAISQRVKKSSIRLGHVTVYFFTIDSSDMLVEKLEV